MSKEQAKELLRSLPAVDALLATPYARRLIAASNRELVRDLARQVLDELRQEVQDSEFEVRGSDEDSAQQTNGDASNPAGEVARDKGQGTRDSVRDLVEKEIEARLTRRAEALLQPSLRRVINATGVILHTNLGRAPLARAAIEAVAEVAAGYCNLEYDLSAGERGRREWHCQNLLARLTGGEDAIVTNNGAAAVLLVLDTFAEGGEVIVSRGELIEIGGSFRIPDVMQKSGARLREVGATNRTRLADYENAINDNTRLLLRVHPSNYRIIGFTERPTLAELAALSARSGVPAIEDAGSGCLVDLAPYGVADEPLVSASLAAGISLVTFSGDKLLGGAQAGIIVGKREMIARLRRNPLMRALRVDKMTYAALEATLRLYERGAAMRDVPALRMLAVSAAESQARAAAFKTRLEAALLEAGAAGDGRADALDAPLKISLEEGAAVVGGGSAPEAQLPGALVALRSDRLSASALAERLRRHTPPIIVRAERNRVLIDLRTVACEEEAILLEALLRLAQPAEPSAASVKVP